MWVGLFFIIASITFGTLIGIISTINEYAELAPTSYVGDPILGLIGTILDIIVFSISIIYVMKLFKMSADSVKWTNITFISSIVLILFSIIGIFINTGNFTASLVDNIPTLIVVIIFWVLFLKHLKKLYNIS